MPINPPTAFVGWMRTFPAWPWKQLCTGDSLETCWNLLYLQAAHVCGDAERDGRALAESLVVLPKGEMPALAPRKR